MLEKCIISIQKVIFINTWVCQIIKKKQSWIINMILLIYFFKHINMVTGLEMKNRLIQQEKVAKKNLLIQQGKRIKKNLLIKQNLQIFSDMSQLESNEAEVKEGKGSKILTPNKLLSRPPILFTQIKAEIIHAY